MTMSTETPYMASNPPANDYKVLFTATSPPPNDDKVIMPLPPYATICTTKWRRGLVHGYQPTTKWRRAHHAPTTVYHRMRTSTVWWGAWLPILSVHLYFCMFWNIDDKNTIRYVDAIMWMSVQETNWWQVVKTHITTCHTWGLWSSIYTSLQEWTKIRWREQSECQ